MEKLVLSTNACVALEITQNPPSSLDYFDDELLVDNDDESPMPDSKVNKEVSLLLDHVDGMIGCLVRLLPDLRDPFPVDTYSSASTPTDSHPDIDLAATLFPTASQSLLARLGRANWRRRLYLKNLHEKRVSGVSQSKYQTIFQLRSISPIFALSY